jgi:hypothetical protein
MPPAPSMTGNDAADVVGLQAVFDDEIDMAGGKQRIGIAVAAVAEEPHLALDLAVFLHLLAGEEMRRGGEQDGVRKMSHWRVASRRRPPARIDRAALPSAK